MNKTNQTALRLSCMVLTFCLATPIRAETTMLAPFKDNSIFSTSTNSNGAGDGLFSGRTGPAGGLSVLRALLAFDVAGEIPPGATITSASLTLTLLLTGPAGSQTHTLHRVLADWGEGTSNAFGGTGAPPTTGDATWLHTFYPDQMWANAGGDFSATVSASQLVGTATSTAYTWGPSPQLVSDVQDMLDNPGANYGWVLIGNESSGSTAKKLASKDHPTPSFRPVLTVEYEPPSAPATSAWGLLALAVTVLSTGCILMRRHVVSKNPD